MRPGGDVAVAGAGIVGLAIAHEALQRGLTVAVVDRDPRAGGASVRNFGHVSITAQTGPAHQFGLAGRRTWLELRGSAGLTVHESGAVVVARSQEELRVLQEFAHLHPHLADVLDPAEVVRAAPVSPRDVVGGARFPLDLRVDPRNAVGGLARYLQQHGVSFHWSTSALGVADGVLRTSRGDIPADAVVLALGHDLDRVLPADAAAGRLGRCRLHMLRIAAPSFRSFRPAVLTGTSLYRYSAFAALPSHAALAGRLRTDRPELVAAGVNLLVTQLPDGDLLIGDTTATRTTRRRSPRNASTVCFSRRPPPCWERPTSWSGNAGAARTRRHPAATTSSPDPHRASAPSPQRPGWG